MGEADDVDLPKALAEIAARDDDPGSWMSGKVRLFLGSGEMIEGILERIDDGEAVVATAAGERRVAVDEVIDLHYWLQSTGPE